MGKNLLSLKDPSVPPTCSPGLKPADYAQQPIYAVGKNEETVRLGRQGRLLAILDDGAKPGEQWQGIAVIRPTEIPDEAVVVNCASSVAPALAAQRIARLRPRAKILTYRDLSEADPTKFPPPRFVRETRQELDVYADFWIRLEGILEDQESKQVLSDVRKFRLTGDPGVLAGYGVRTDRQYFEPFLEFKPGEVFVDGGGFDGDTAAEFIRRCPDYKKIWFFEPSEKNMSQAKARLASARDVEFCSEGISDGAGTLGFDPHAGSASAIQTRGEACIRVISLDERIRGTVSLIKLDVEGWELPALRGAAGHIRKYHPKLAVAVYHHPADFRQIPEFILNLGKDYRVYLRHYTQGWSETIMYFIPSKI